MAAEDADGAPNQEEGLVWEQKAEAYVEGLLSTPPPAPPGATVAGAETAAAAPAPTPGQKVLIGVRTRPLLADETPKVGKAIPGSCLGGATADSHPTSNRRPALQRCSTAATSLTPAAAHLLDRRRPRLSTAQARREARWLSSITPPSWQTKPAIRSMC